MSKRRLKVKLCNRSLGALGAGAILFQLGGCDFGQITTTTTLDGRELVISLIQGAILNPIESYITDTVNNAFGDEDD